MRPVRSDRNVRVGDRQDARLQRDLLTTLAFRVAPAVNALVVTGYPFGDLVHAWNGGNDITGVNRMHVQQVHLLDAEDARFSEDALGHRELAYVMQQGGDTKLFDPDFG